MEHHHALSHKRQHGQDAVGAAQREAYGLLDAVTSQGTFASDLTNAADVAVCDRRASPAAKECCSRVRLQLLRDNNTSPAPDAPLRLRLRYALLCPPHGTMASALVQGAAAFLAWALLWAVTGKQGLPGGMFFGLWCLYVACHVAAWLATKAHLPGLLGMLVAGCVLGNVPHVDVARDVDGAWSTALRTSALGVILLRAGLGLNPADLRRLSWAVVRLAFLPCLTEAITCMITSHMLLGMPWLWGLMLGFVLAAVSPAVVVPSMLALQERGRGVEQGIPTLVLAAASIDDILAISAFGVILGITLGKSENLALTIARGPLEALGGVVYGVGVGIALWFFPSADSKGMHMWRLLLLLGFGQLALFGSQAAGVEGAGALGCLVLAFTAAIRWRREISQSQPPSDEIPTEAALRTLWQQWQPFLFGLIGAAVNVSSIDRGSLGLGVAVLFIGLALRMVVSFLAVFGTGLNHKEKLFVSVAWLPKATVQAAIGSVAYDAAHRIGDADGMALGSRILMIAVLSIVITAPLGAGAIALTAPRLLRIRAMQPTASTDEAEEFTETIDGPQKQQPAVRNGASFFLDTEAQPTLRQMYVSFHRSTAPVRYQ